MKTQIPKAELKMIKDAHHATNLDNPQEVNENIEFFLQQF